MAVLMDPAEFRKYDWADLTPVARELETDLRLRGATDAPVANEVQALRDLAHRTRRT